MARWVAIELDKIAGLPDFFGNLHDWARAVDWPDEARLGAAIERAGTALERYEKVLRGLPTTTSFHVGEATATRLVETCGIELSLAELRDMAAGFLAETMAAIEDLRGRLADKYGLDPDGDGKPSENCPN